MEPTAEKAVACWSPRLTKENEKGDMVGGRRGDRKGNRERERERGSGRGGGRGGKSLERKRRTMSEKSD